MKEPKPEGEHVTNNSVGLTKGLEYRIKMKLKEGYHISRSEFVRAACEFYLGLIDGNFSFLLSFLAAQEAIMKVQMAKGVKV